MSPSPTSSIRIQHISAKSGGSSIAIAITRKRRVRRISLRVTTSGEVKATAPQRCTINEVMAFATKKTAWIEARLQAVARLYTPDKPAILYQGVLTPIRLRPTAPMSAPVSAPVAHQDGCLWVNGASGLPVVLLENHLRQHATQAIAKHLPSVLQEIGESEIPFSLSQAKTRWGSCHWRTPRGLALGLGHKTARRLRFNWRLAMATPKALCYVVVHEAAHLRHPNHSRQFWQLVGDLMPDWREGYTWLRHHQPQLLIDFDRQLKHLTAEVATSKH